MLSFWQTAAEDAHRPPDTTAALTALHARDPEALILAVDDGRIIGTVIAGWDGWRAHLYRLAVAPDRRRAGIGKALVGAAENRFQALGAIRIDAMVLDGNTQAHATWSATGFRPQPEWSRWIKPL